MSNPQMKEFYGRLRRVERIHRRGGGFEAVGTLSRSVYVERRTNSLFRPLLVTLCVGIALKVALLLQIGTTDYQERVDRLAQGGQTEKVGAFIMQADPLTVWLADRTKEIFAVPS